MKKTIIGLIAIVAIAAAVIFGGCVEKEAPAPTPTPTTPTYTAEIEKQGDTMIIVRTHNVGKINADKLWVKFEHPKAIKITNKKEKVNYIFYYDPTETCDGGDYSISGGEKGVPTYEILVYVCYSYAGKGKLIKEEIIEYRNPNK